MFRSQYFLRFFRGEMSPTPAQQPVKLNRYESDLMKSEEKPFHQPSHIGTMDTQLN